MKKVLLVGVNAKYIHSNLAIRALRQTVAPRPVAICDLTINDSLQHNLAFLMDADADIYGFSCYIFNIERVLKLAELVKKSKPEATILLGGPEVSFETADLLARYDFIDVIITGEGEQSFKTYLDSVDHPEKALADTPGIVTRSGGTEIYACVPEMDALPFPYTAEDIAELNNRIIYYESMRGCPFRCAYCLSSAVSSVRFRSLDKVFAERIFSSLTV